MTRKLRTPKVCPVCGEDVPRTASACPECGADHTSGWREMPKHTMPWLYRTRTSATKSSLNRSLDHLEDRRSKQFGGSLQSCLLLPLSRSISMLLTDRSSQRLAVVMISSQYV